MSQANCLWADLDDNFPPVWPENVPPPSATVETSPGKYQLFWFLTTAAHDLDLVERIEDGLAEALSADPAATDRARVLRLPGFPNLKYDSRPLSRLLELHPERRFTLRQFAGLIPPSQRLGDNGEPHSSVGGANTPCHDHASPSRSDEDRQEFRRLMAKKGVVPGTNPTWCFAHDDHREGGIPSLIRGLGTRPV